MRVLDVQRGVSGRGEWVLVHDGDRYYHCFFDMWAVIRHGSGTLICDECLIVTEQEYHENTWKSDLSWRYMQANYKGFPYIKILRKVYENREATKHDWGELLERPLVFFMLAALS